MAAREELSSSRTEFSLPLSPSSFGLLSLITSCVVFRSSQFFQSKVYRLLQVQIGLSKDTFSNLRPRFVQVSLALAFWYLFSFRLFDSIWMASLFDNLIRTRAICVCDHTCNQRRLKDRQTWRRCAKRKEKERWFISESRHEFHDRKRKLARKNENKREDREQKRFNWKGKAWAVGVEAWKRDKWGVETKRNHSGEA